MNKDKFIKLCKTELMVAIKERVQDFLDDDKSALFALVSGDTPPKTDAIISPKEALACLLDEDEITPEEIKKQFCNAIDKQFAEFVKTEFVKNNK